MFSFLLKYFILFSIIYLGLIQAEQSHNSKIIKKSLIQNSDTEEYESEPFNNEDSIDNHKRVARMAKASKTKNKSTKDNKSKVLVNLLKTLSGEPVDLKIIYTDSLNNFWNNSQNQTVLIEDHNGELFKLVGLKVETLKKYNLTRTKSNPNNEVDVKVLDNNSVVISSTVTPPITKLNISSLLYQVIGELDKSNTKPEKCLGDNNTILQLIRQNKLVKMATNKADSDNLVHIQCDMEPSVQIDKDFFSKLSSCLEKATPAKAAATNRKKGTKGTSKKPTTTTTTEKSDPQDYVADSMTE